MRLLRCGCLAVLLLAAWLLCPAPAHAIKTWTITPVSGIDNDNNSPDVYGDWVTWVAPVGSITATFLRNVNSPDVANISGSFLKTSHPSIGREFVVFEEGDAAEHDILSWEWRHGQLRIVAGGPAMETEASTDGRWCAFVLHDGQDSEIVVRPVAFDDPVQITNDAVEDGHPDVSGDLVTWLAGPAPYKVMLYSIAEKWTTTLASGGGTKSSPSTDGRRVVWAQSDGNDTEIMMLDTADYNIIQLTNDGVNDTSPVVSGFRVAWVSNIGSGSHILARDLRTTGVMDLSGGAFSDGSPQISGPRVVWHRLEGIGPGGLHRSIQRADFIQFPDVPANHPNYFAIQSLADEGTVGGYGDGTFGPGTSLLRAQFAKIIVEALGYQVDESAWDPASPPFNDLGPDDPGSFYPHDYVAVAAEQGITVGTGGAAFSPWAALSRAQMVTLTMRAVHSRYGVALSVPAGYQGTFGDFDPTHALAMKLAELFHLTDGVVGFGPSWNPWAPATRAEMAQLVWAVQDTFEGRILLD